MLPCLPKRLHQKPCAVKAPVKALICLLIAAACVWLVRPQYDVKSAFKAPEQIHVILTNPQGDIFNPAFLKTIIEATDAFFYIPGVDRTRITSLATVNFNYLTDEGFDAQHIIPEDAQFSAPDIQKIKNNTLRSPYIGKLVSKDLTSSLILIPLLYSANGEDVAVRIDAFLKDKPSIHYELLGKPALLAQVKEEIPRSLLIILSSIVCAVAVWFLAPASFSLIWTIVVAATILCLSIFGIGSSQGIIFKTVPHNYDFEFSTYSMRVTAVANHALGCADPQTMFELDNFHNFVAAFPGVKSVWSMAEAVKSINAFFHNDDPKWRQIPRDQRELVFITGAIDPKTGLVDYEGHVMPVTIFFDRYDPKTFAQVLTGIKNFPAQRFNVALAGGTVTAQTLEHQRLTQASLLVIAALLLSAWVYAQTSSRLIFLTVFILTLGMLGITGIGLNTNTFMALIAGSALSVFLLNKKRPKLALVLAIAFCGGLYSQLQMIAQPCAVMVWILGTTLLGLLIKTKKVPED